jgi:superoxide dismutase, Cu-Zn family
MKIMLIAAITLLLAVGTVGAEEMVVEMHQIDDQGIGPVIGTVTASTSAYGTLLTPHLNGLAPGLHGFHVHTNPSCDPMSKDNKMVAGLAAGGHYDPSGSGQHLGPYANGHLGDLPPLYVGADGTATQPVLAPRIKLSDLKGRSLMIHAGGDNYSDDPDPLGGGGARMACGVAQ